MNAPVTRNDPPAAAWLYQALVELLALTDCRVDPTLGSEMRAWLAQAADAAIELVHNGANEPPDREAYVSLLRTGIGALSMLVDKYAEQRQEGAS